MTSNIHLCMLLWHLLVQSVPNKLPSGQQRVPYASLRRSHISAWLNISISNQTHTLSTYCTPEVKNLSLISVSYSLSHLHLKWDAWLLFLWTDGLWAHYLSSETLRRKRLSICWLMSGFVSDIITIFLHQQIPQQTHPWIPAVLN